MGNVLFKCDVCGKYTATFEALDDYLRPNTPVLTSMHRAILSHQIRLKSSQSTASILISTDAIESLIQSNQRLPSPSQQVMNALRIIGNLIREDFQPLTQLPTDFHSTIGAPNRAFGLKLVRSLIGKGLMSGVDAATFSDPYGLANIDLTLDGWEQFEQEKSGQFSSSYGFIALKFGDEILDPFVSSVIKPGVKTLGFDLVDLRDVARAGIIDNILRAQIRDAAFMLVDLTHENRGAYWEAGYAEGLGKPVIYICERSKFNEHASHFDTNHCTTVMWSSEKGTEFIRELNATIRRSLGL